MRILAALLLLGGFIQPPTLPGAVSPFPTGLSGGIVFMSDRPGADNPQGRNHIFALDLASGRVSQLTSGRDHHDQHPKWSPDGRRISFVSSRGGNFDLYVMNADGTNVTRVTDHPANDFDPIWMPDGLSLIFSSERDSRSDLYRVWLKDRRVDRLTQHFVGRAIMPSVSPDGKSVAFAAQTLQRLQFWEFQIHVLDLATGKTRALDNSGGACWPSWSPDGRLIANVLLAKEPSTIQVRSPNGGGARELPSIPKLWSYYPDWSTDGKWIALSVSPQHHEGEDWDLAIVPADGSGPPRKLTTGAGNDRLPDWKP
ncbi:MAG TPA: DPP IV N-terminal domain-containing protein [Vicinamibacterales bacterium]|nr:DPP IV N-terminal domain-containing protein [Vicinamibacterales bacterium]